MLTLLIEGLLIVTAPCCSGGGSMPGLILGNEKAQFSLQASFGSVVADASVTGGTRFRESSDDEDSLTMGVAGGFLLSDRWQTGAALNLGHRTLDRSSVKSSGSGLGDLKLHLGYEALPLWSYSRWKPKGFLFFNLVAPTGASTHDSEKPGAADAFGAGFWSAGLGVLFVKTWTSWDVSLFSQGQYSLPRTFKSPREIRVEPGFQSASQFGIGWSPGAKALRVGARVGPSWREGGRSRLYGETTKGVHRLVWDSMFELSYMVADHISASASYNDQTLLGPRKNSSLSRVGSVSVQYRWLR
jgi:hypothetical protein